MPPVGHSDTLVDLQLGSAGVLEGCISADLPSPSLDVPAQKVWSADGKPTNINGSASMQWTDASVTFLATNDSLSKANQALTKAHDDPDGAKETITLVLKDKQGTPIATYAMQQALVKSVTPPKPDAGGSGFLTSTLSIHAEDVQMS
jgi:hypothetical protein